MASSIKRSKSREASPIDTNRGATPLRENHQAQLETLHALLAARTHSSSEQNTNGRLTADSNPSSWTQSTSSSNRDRFRQLTQDLLNLPEMRDSRDTDSSGRSALNPPKFDPRGSENMDIHSAPRESIINSFQGAERGTMWPLPPGSRDNADNDNHPKAYSGPLGKTETRYVRHVPQSKSEGQIKSCLKPSPYASPSYSGYQTPIMEEQSPAGPASSPVLRGRGREKARSPVRFIDDIDEHQYDPVPFLKSPVRRSRSPHKKLFGENGWLGRSTSMKELPAEKYKKPGFKAFGEKLKQRVGDITGDVMKVTPNPFHQESSNKIVSQSTFPISLDPPSQAKLYSEMEVMICVTANMFLLQQYKEGRISVESVTKVTNFWTSKNRPQVVEFQFDQATQRDLILHNIKTFRFFGESATNLFVLNGTLYNWKAVAKEMSIRTFCTPDSVIRKHMHDTHKILELLGAPLVTFLAFQELQVRTLAQMREEQKKKLQPSKDHGVTKEYIPPSLVEAEKAEAAAAAQKAAMRRSR